VPAEREVRGGRLPLPAGMSRGRQVSLVLDGAVVQAYESETIATVLIAEGFDQTRTTVRGQPRGVFCGMGVCFDCLVVVNGVPNTRACMTWATDEMVVSTQQGLSATHD
jgi:D-hydroxyproline dehydrogenase subunit gamma